MRHSKLDGSGSEGDLEVPDISELRVPSDEDDIFLVPRTLSEVSQQNSNSPEEIPVEPDVKSRCGDRDWFPQLSEWGHSVKSSCVQQTQPPSPNTNGPQIFDVDDEITILSDAEETTEIADDKENQHPNATAEVSSVNNDDDVEIIVKDVQELENLPFKIDAKDDDEEICLQVSDNESEGSVEQMSVDESKFQNGESQQEDVAETMIVINNTDCPGSKESLLKHW